jgi:FkbH-like protein
VSADKVKCVVWDLDNTIWDGILAESDQVTLKNNIKPIITELDNRGILQSISSKNDYDVAKAKLKEFQLWDYFIYPQINWNPKSEAIKTIAKSINIGIDTLAFVDDQPFELEEVGYACPDVRCINANELEGLLDMDCMNPKFVTSDSKNRRQLYQNDITRNAVEKDFNGTQEEFLASLNMNFRISRAKESDLQRVEELTVRTHQLNSTGYIYSYDELCECIKNDKYEVLVTRLDDKYGSYGTIGLSLIEKYSDIWEVKLLIMSCRVMSRGVGNILLNHICNEARKSGVKVRAQFVPTDRNRIMYITYKFNGFKEVNKDSNGTLMLEADMSRERSIPSYVNVIVE